MVRRSSGGKISTEAKANMERTGPVMLLARGSATERLGNNPARTDCISNRAPISTWTSDRTAASSQEGKILILLPSENTLATISPPMLKRITNRAPLHISGLTEGRSLKDRGRIKVQELQRASTTWVTSTGGRSL